MSRLFIIFQYLLPQHLLSRLVGMLARSRMLRKPFIKFFIRRYGVDLSEALIQDPDEFENFNAFFTRELREGARTLSSEKSAVLCPADGAISQLGEIQDGNLLQAKGRYYSLQDLLGGDCDMADLFQEGCFATVYLSPRDYHRVHMPLEGTLRKTIYVPGDLFSVNQTTAAAVPNLFSRNERLVCLFETDSGPMAVILVGAMIVAGIDTVWSGEVCPGKGKREILIHEYSDNMPPVNLGKGAEMGRFKLGSTAILLFSHGSVTMDEKLEANSPVLMGQKIGTLLNTAQQEQ